MSQSMQTKLALASLPKVEKPRTLLEGKEYHGSATHSDPALFFRRMLQYGLRLKERK